MNDDHDNAQTDREMLDHAALSEIVEGVKAHALAHYNDGGWDVIVECWTDAEIGEHVKKYAITTDGTRSPVQNGYRLIRHGDRRMERSSGGRPNLVGRVVT